ncbi:hypothetical protein LDENG_00067420, partial [Lucifuga dentata]
MQPHLLAERLLHDFNLPHQLILWSLDFLINREQRDSKLICTGSPQGCVLSPLLFLLYTDSCRSNIESSYLVKFSDDTVLLSLLQGPQSDQGKALSDFVGWYDNNFLDLNVSKTKELIIDFRRSKEEVKDSVIHGDRVETVTSYKYLGTVFDDQLKWDHNTDVIMKRGQQRIHLLRKLDSFSVSPVILCRFYQSFIENVLT